MLLDVEVITKMIYLVEYISQNNLQGRLTAVQLVPLVVFVCIFIILHQLHFEEINIISNPEIMWQ